MFKPKEFFRVTVARAPNDESRPEEYWCLFVTDTRVQATRATACAVSLANEMSLHVRQRNADHIVLASRDQHFTLRAVFAVPTEKHMLVTSGDVIVALTANLEQHRTWYDTNIAPVLRMVPVAFLGSRLDLPEPILATTWFDLFMA